MLTGRRPGWRPQNVRAGLSVVMPALVAGIHVFTDRQIHKTWMAGTSPAMTVESVCLEQFPTLRP
jgi:hypothetical protein